ncbi:MAG: hypothetical protein J6Y57_10890 [Lachnospiraceae bacterium]|nr:hypothetical protein [Lachnospiraceae bacterium]
MKKRSFVGILCIVLGLILVCGCGVRFEGAAPADTQTKPEQAQEEAVQEEEQEEAVEEPEAAPEEEAASSASWGKYDVMYESVFAEVLDVIQNGYDYDKLYSYISNGLIEAVQYPGDEDPLEKVGYVMDDISGDGIPELLIGEDDSIFAIFTIEDEEPAWVLEGWSRNSYSRMEDGHFYNKGSGGSSIVLFGECYLSKDATRSIWVDYYFTDEKNGEIHFYHNTSGEYDTESSDEIEASEETFSELMSGYESRCQSLDWTPIGTRTGAGDTAEAAQ